MIDVSDYKGRSKEELLYAIVELASRNAQLSTDYQQLARSVDESVLQLQTALAKLQLDEASSSGTALSPDDAELLTAYKAVGSLDELRAAASRLHEYESLGLEDVVASKLALLDDYKRVGSLSEVETWKAAAVAASSSEAIAREATIAALRRFASSQRGIPTGLITWEGGSPSSAAFPWSVASYSVDVAETASKCRIGEDEHNWFHPARALKLVVKLPKSTFGTLIAVKGSVKIRTKSSATVSTVGLGEFCINRGGHVLRPKAGTSAAAGKLYSSTAYAPLIPASWGAVGATETRPNSWVVDNDTLLIADSTNATNLAKDLAIGLIIASTAYGILEAKIDGVAIVAGADCARTSTGALRFSDTGQATSLGALGGTGEQYAISAAMLRQPIRLQSASTMRDLQLLIDAL